MIKPHTDADDDLTFFNKNENDNNHLFWISGCVASSQRVNDMFVAVVSWPSNINVSTLNIVDNIDDDGNDSDSDPQT